MPLLKRKWKHHDPTALLRVREVITHGSHPTKRLCCHFGVCLTMLWKYAASLPGSIERVSMQDLLGFIESLKTANCDDGSVRGELDLVEMVPNIPRSKIFAAICYFWKKLSKEKRWDIHKSGFHVLRAGVRTLDYMGSKSGDTAFQFFSFHGFICFMNWEGLFNDRFVHFSSILPKTMGTAIGGTCSAQSASITLLYLETRRKPQSLPPLMRYRDNHLVMLPHTKPGLSPKPALLALAKKLKQVVHMHGRYRGRLGQISQFFGV